MVVVVVVVVMVVVEDEEVLVQPISMLMMMTTTTMTRTITYMMTMMSMRKVTSTLEITKTLMMMTSMIGRVEYPYPFSKNMMLGGSVPVDVAVQVVTMNPARLLSLLVSFSPVNSPSRGRQFLNALTAWR